MNHLGQMVYFKHYRWVLFMFPAALVGAAVFGIPLEVSAQDFVPIQEVPRIIEPKASFADFVNGIFWAAVVAGGALAVIMISIGGFQYMGGESVFSKEEGIKKIQDAVLGLLLILLTVVIFGTINPDILELRLDVPETQQERVDLAPPGGSERERVLPFDEASEEEQERRRNERATGVSTPQNE